MPAECIMIFGQQMQKFDPLECKRFVDLWPERWGEMNAFYIFLACDMEALDGLFP